MFNQIDDHNILVAGDEDQGQDREQNESGQESETAVDDDENNEY